MKKIKSFFTKMKENDLCKNIVLYTIIFAFLMGYLFFLFAKYDKTFITDVDGVKSHFIHLTYFRELLVNFIRTGNFSTLTWYIGNGIDLFVNYAYLVFGDIFSYLAVLFRTKQVQLVYNILIVLRFYFTGISFLIFAKYKKLNKVSTIIGTLLYTFSAYALYNNFFQPYYIPAMIIFPLLIMGIERIIKDNKYILYTILISILYLGNFYFAYSLSLILAIYGFLFTIFNYKDEGFKKIIKVLLKVLLFSLIGIMISSVILLPVLTAFVDSSRNFGNVASNYSVSYYRNFINSIFSLTEIGYSVSLGTQSIIYLALPMLILRKKPETKPIIILLFVLLLPLLIPFIGSIFAGFSFPNNRWSFVFSFIFAYLISIFFNENLKIEKKDILFILSILVITLVINILCENALTKYILIQLALLFVWIVFFINKKYFLNLSSKINMFNLISMILIIIGLGTSIKYTFDLKGANFITQFVEQKTINDVYNTSYNYVPDFNKAVNYLKEYDQDFYKISRSPYGFEDISLAMHFNSPGEYLPMFPKIYQELGMDLMNSQFYMLRGIKEFDYRTKISTLLGNKYLIISNYNTIPYGYTKIDDFKGKADIYQNDYYLPFGTLYTKYLTEDEYNKLSALEKEDSLLKAAVINDNVSSKYEHFDIDDISSIEEIDYKLVDKQNLMQGEKNFSITDISQNRLQLSVENVEDCELYVLISNLTYEPFNKQEIIDLALGKNASQMEKVQTNQTYRWYDPSNAFNIRVQYLGISKNYNRYSYDSPYYIDYRNFLFNLGYYEKTSGIINIKLSVIGNYSFDSIKVFSVKMDNYAKDIENLRESNFKVTNYQNGYLKGTVNAEEAGILQFQTLYSKGWDVYVDGQKVEALKVNKYFLGTEITKGNHEIILKYHIPNLKIGAIFSLCGIGIFTSVIIFQNKRKKRGK